MYLEQFLRQAEKWGDFEHIFNKALQESESNCVWALFSPIEHEGWTSGSVVVTLFYGAFTPQIMHSVCFLSLFII